MNRIERVRNIMKQNDAEQMIICNPADVYYLSGQQTKSEERFMGIIFGADGVCRLFTNPLFTLMGKLPEEMETVSVVYGEKDTEVMAKYLNNNRKVLVDPMLPAAFLLPLMSTLQGIQMLLDENCMNTVRAVKDEEEIEKMIVSSQINDNVMKRLCSMLHEGITEKEIYSRTEEIYRECGADEMAFAGICFGENTAQPHHILAENRKLKKGDCVLFDIGGKYKGYCSDMTRTFSLEEYPNYRKRCMNWFLLQTGPRKLLLSPV